MGEVEEVVLKAITEAKATSTRVLLVLDGIDFLLAATEITVDDLLDCVLEFREVCHRPLVKRYRVVDNTLEDSVYRSLTSLPVCLHNHRHCICRLSAYPSATFTIGA